MWEGGEAWIIGGGASMPRIFGVPGNIISDVQEGRVPYKVYADYLKPLYDKNVIATNTAFKLGSWISVLYYCDKQFWLANRDSLAEFHNLKVTDVGNMPPRFEEEHHNIKKMKRDNAAGICEDPGMIKWNRNAGGGAINLAYHFGVRRILLLGYDMKADRNGKTHWHTGEPNYKHPTPDRTFVRFLKMYPFIKRDADRLGLEILNVTDNSALDVFPKVKLKDIL
jgi:hypothetical protein